MTIMLTTVKSGWQPRGRPKAQERCQLSSKAESGTEQTPGSTSAEDPSQVRDATQDTQVEGHGSGAGQPEVKLCLQLSSEDQDPACCQQPFPFLQPVGVHGLLQASALRTTVRHQSPATTHCLSLCTLQSLHEHPSLAQ